MWQDRRIEAGDDWYNSIHEAMKDCDLGLLLVSPEYLASRFIQDEEVWTDIATVIEQRAKARILMS